MAATDYKILLSYLKQSDC